jgi:hypothetical protein
MNRVGVEVSGCVGVGVKLDEGVDVGVSVGVGVGVGDGCVVGLVIGGEVNFLA